MRIELEILPGKFAISRLSPDANNPGWAKGEDFVAVVRTKDELSIVCEEAYVPGGIKTEPGWRIMKVRGPLDFSLVGILANLSKILASAGISIFALSTFETDYILVKNRQFDEAVRSLKKSGYIFV